MASDNKVKGNKQQKPPSQKSSGAPKQSQTKKQTSNVQQGQKKDSFQPAAAQPAAGNATAPAAGASEAAGAISGAMGPLMDGIMGMIQGIFAKVSGGLGGGGEGGQKAQAGEGEDPLKAAIAQFKEALKQVTDNIGSAGGGGGAAPAAGGAGGEASSGNNINVQKNDKPGTQQTTQTGGQTNLPADAGAIQASVGDQLRSQGIDFPIAA